MQIGHAASPESYSELSIMFVNWPALNLHLDLAYIKYKFWHYV